MSGTVVGIGTDLIAVDRLRAALDRQSGLPGRLFSAAERADVLVHSDQVPYLAERFAAKESVMKALGRGLGAMEFTEIEVAAAPGGAPSVVLSGRAAALADDLGVSRWHLSLTHTAALAQAVVIAVS